MRVLLALFDNALDAVSARRAASGDERFRPTIRVSTYVSGGSVCVRVEDNGAGIDPAIQARIFEPFFTTKPMSRGLGLSLAYDIVVSGHNGALAVENVAGGGAAFIVTLPRGATSKAL